MHLNNRYLVIAVTLAGLLATGYAAAQPSERDHGKHGKHRMPHGAEQQLARLDEALDLSDEQSAELLPILQNAESERRALHERMQEEFRPELCAMMGSTHSRILSVLTPEQAEHFDEIKSQRSERRHQGRGRPNLDCEGLDA